MITLGIQLEGPELKDTLIDRALLLAAQTAMRVREPNYKALNEGWINPIYIVPGTVSKPEFDGFELGHFSKKDRGLAVAIAVPQTFDDGNAMIEYIAYSLREATRLAAAHFASKGISLSTLKAEKIILAIETALKTEFELRITGTGTTATGAKTPN